MKSGLAYVGEPCFNRRNMIRKYIAETGFFSYWLLQGMLCAWAARLPGYYPPGSRQMAQALAEAAPLPWISILIAWAIMGLLTACLYYIWKRASTRYFHLVLFSALFWAIYVILSSTDRGGLDTAFALFFTANLLLTLLALAWDSHRQKRRKTPGSYSN